jgi:hypothetical protein
MVWDADGYMSSSVAIVQGTFDASKFTVRGVLTSLVYVIPSFVGLYICSGFVSKCIDSELGGQLHHSAPA